MEISQKILTPHSLPFESLKIIKTDTDRSVTCDFLLVFHSNSLYLTVSEKNGNICKKNHPLYLMPAEGFPLEFYNSGGAGEKLER